MWAPILLLLSLRCKRGQGGIWCFCLCVVFPWSPFRVLCGKAEAFKLKGHGVVSRWHDTDTGLKRHWIEVSSPAALWGQGFMVRLRQGYWVAGRYGLVWRWCSVTSHLLQKILCVRWKWEPQDIQGLVWVWSVHCPHDCNWWKWFKFLYPNS